MDIPQVPAGSIVVGVDGSPSSAVALDWATDQAALEQRPLTVAHSVEPTGVYGVGLYGSTGVDYGRYLDEIRGASLALLAAATDRATERQPTLDVHRILAFADPRSTLLDLGDRAAMVVVGSRGRGPIASLLLGSVSVAVSKHASCPVVVLRPTDPDRSTLGILVGVDGTENSLPAIEYAYRMASFRSSPLTVLHCYWTPGSVAVATAGAPEVDISDERALVAESLAGMAEKFPDVEVTVHLVPGFADHQLIAASPDYDLVVIGHHRLSPLNDLVYGSVSPTVVEHAVGAVAVVPTHTLAAELPTGG